VYTVGTTTISEWKGGKGSPGPPILWSATTGYMRIWNIRISKRTQTIYHL